MFSGLLLIEQSKDPNYYIDFSYINDKYNITKGVAVFKRVQPEPKVEFSNYTEYVLERFQVDDETIDFIKLQVGKTVCDYLFKKKRK